METTTSTRPVRTVQTIAQRVAGQIVRPFSRTVTARRTASQAARRRLRAYEALLSHKDTQHEANAQRVLALLWAQAAVEDALYHETQGRMGHGAMSTASAVLRRYEAEREARRLLSQPDA